MIEVPTYVCEKCGYFEIGKENRAKVQRH